MEAQWYLLRQALGGNLENIKQLKEPFFHRLIQVLSSQQAGPADKAKACQDALRCALVHGVTEPALHLPGLAFSGPELALAGLCDEPLTGRIILNDEDLSDSERAVYQRVQRRHLVKVNIDVALSKDLKDDSYTHYNGRGQQIAVRAVLTSPEDSTLIVNLPTGCGKTLVIHALTLLTAGQQLNLVIVPTIGLAIEQAERVRVVLKKANQDHGGPYAWYGNQSKDSRQQIRDRLNNGTQRILFCSPESMTGALLPVLFRLAQGGQLGSLIVDEAHLIDQWGAEFRPEFQLLSPLIRSLQILSGRGIRKILMSATFSPATLQTLRDLFVEPGHQAIEINGSFLRPEPSYDLTRASGEQEHREKVMEAVWRMPRPLILYTMTVDDARNWYQKLRSEGFNRVGLFTGKTSTDEREEIIKQWRDDELDVIVATSAFGVGMDKADVRSVLHAAVPENLDRFYQESGRGGRDGNASLASLIYHQKQVEAARNNSVEKLITAELGLERWRHMHHSAHNTDQGYLRVSLSSQHQLVLRNSDQNRVWNWRTLLLMRRAGLIRLHITPPCPPQRQDDMSAQAHEVAVDDYYQDYFNQVDVEFLHDGHLNPWIWEEEVNLRRRQEKHAREQAFRALSDWLYTPQKPLCERLRVFYTDSAYAPESACGGCPGCRFNRCKPYTPTLGYADTVLGWQSNSGSQGQIPKSGVLRIRYEERSSPQVLLTDWKHWIDKLLQAGTVQAIRARRDVLDLLKKILPAGGHNFWCSLDHSERESIWPELILLMPDETILPPPSVSDNQRIVVAPDSITDPLAPYRRWWECDPSSMDLEHFCRRINHVDH